MDLKTDAFSNLPIVLWTGPKWENMKKQKTQRSVNLLTLKSITAAATSGFAIDFFLPFSHFVAPSLSYSVFFPRIGN